MLKAILIDDEPECLRSLAVIVDISDDANENQAIAKALARKILDTC